MKVKLLTRVMHDGQAHAEGEVVDIPKADAQALVDSGAAEPHGKAEKAKEEPKDEAQEEPDSSST